MSNLWDWASYQVTILWYRNKFCNQLGNSSFLVGPIVDGVHLWLKMEANKLFWFSIYGVKVCNLLCFFKPVE